MLDRLRGEADAIALLSTVPGFGRVLAERLHDELGLETLADLEAAAHDGRLETLAAFGAKRLAGIRDTLAERLGRIRLPAKTGTTATSRELLDVDREYREKAAAGRAPAHRAAPVQSRRRTRRPIRTRGVGPAGTLRCSPTRHARTAPARRTTGSCSMAMQAPARTGTP